MKTIISFLILSVVFTCFGQSFNFSKKLVTNDRYNDDYFGEEISISGNYAIFGVSKADTDTNGTNYKASAGAAYIFKKINGNWIQVQKIVASDRDVGDQFGISVSISGNYAIIGAHFEDQNATGGSTKNNSGSAYIFKNINGTWIQIKKIVASDRNSSDYFGCSVSISGNYAIVGARWEDHDANGGNTKNNSGSVYIFKNNNGTWAQTQKIVASDRSDNDYFGHEVSIYGNFLAVGTPYEGSIDAGAVYIFKKHNGLWTQSQKIVSNYRGTDFQFGYSVTLNSNFIIVGSRFDSYDENNSNPLTNAGAAYIFKNINGSWILNKKLVASDREAQDKYGWSVSIDSNFAVVGASYENNDAKGGSYLANAGSAYIYANKNGNWTQIQKIVAFDRNQNDFFGYGISISDESIIVGAIFNDYDSNNLNAIQNAGSAYTYNLSNTNFLIWGNDTIISNGDTLTKSKDSTYFGYVNLNYDSNLVTYRILNSGSDTIFLIGNPLIEILGIDSNSFTIVNQPNDSIISPYDSTYFTIKFQTSKTGINSAIVKINYIENEQNQFTYKIQGHGCNLNSSIAIDQNISCHNKSDGALSVNISGGTSPYYYLWNVSDSASSLKNLDTGLYIVIVSDTFGCSDSDTILLSQPDSLISNSIITDVSCFGRNNGEIEVSVTGGTKPYTHLWSNSSTTQKITNLFAGVYSDTIIDLNGCKLVITDTVNQPNKLLPGAILNYNYKSKDTAICFQSNTDTIKSLQFAKGGASSPIYIWQKSNDGIVFNTLVQNDRSYFLPGFLNKSTWYRRLAIDTSCFDTAYSNAIIIQVYKKFKSGIIDGDTSICIYNEAPLILESKKTSGASGKYGFDWQESLDQKNWTIINGIKSKTFQPNNLIESKWFRRIDMDSICLETDTTNNVKIEINPKPIADFTVSNVCENDSVFFLNNSKVSNGNLSYLWSFGDGSSSSHKNPIYLFSTPGNFSIQLISKSNKNCLDTVVKKVAVYENPVANFNINKKEQCLFDNTYILNNQSTNATSYFWNLGDTNQSTNLNITHKYIATGEYWIKLVAISKEGCKDSVLDLVKVNPDPIDTFSFSEQSNGIVQFYSYANPSSKLFWDFGDGAQDSIKNPLHIYNSNKAYIVKLHVTNIYECSSTSQDIITIKTVGLNEFVKKSFILYPNPANVKLYLETNIDIYEVELYNQLGRLLLSKQNQKSIDVSALPKGIYFVKITDLDSGNSVYEKIIKE
jgi:PKD repeat protein